MSPSRIASRSATAKSKLASTWPVSGIAGQVNLYLNLSDSCLVTDKKLVRNMTEDLFGRMTPGNTPLLMLGAFTDIIRSMQRMVIAIETNFDYNAVFEIICEGFMQDKNSIATSIFAFCVTEPYVEKYPKLAKWGAESLLLDIKDCEEDDQMPSELREERISQARNAIDLLSVYMDEELASGLEIDMGLPKGAESAIQYAKNLKEGGADVYTLTIYQRMDIVIGNRYPVTTREDVWGLVRPRIRTLLTEQGFLASGFGTTDKIIQCPHTVADGVDVIGFRCFEPKTSADIDAEVNELKQKEAEEFGKSEEN